MKRNFNFREKLHKKIHCEGPVEGGASGALGAAPPDELPGTGALLGAFPLDPVVSNDGSVTAAGPSCAPTSSTDESERSSTRARFSTGDSDEPEDREIEGDGPAVCCGLMGWGLPGVLVGAPFLSFKTALPVVDFSGVFGACGCECPEVSLAIVVGGCRRGLCRVGVFPLTWRLRVVRGGLSYSGFTRICEEA